MRSAVVVSALSGLVLTIAMGSWGCAEDETSGPTKPATAPATSGTTAPPKPPPVATSNPEFDGGLPATCDPGPDADLYSFSAQDLLGTESVPLCRFRGKVLMIVNVASKCGNTPQYAPLQAFYEKYRDKGFYVLAFPCNQFGGQEPGTPADITACLQDYKVSFPVFAKIDVNGTGAHPLFDWLKSQPGGSGNIEWNFAKFLVGRDGRLIKRYAASDLNGGVNHDVIDQAIAAAVAE